MMRNKAKAGIDKVSRGARKATDKIAEASDANRKPSSRTKAKMKSAMDRTGDKVKSAGKRVSSKTRARTR